MNFVFVYVPCPSKEEAKKIAKHLLDKKLIACTNIFPIESMFYWKGKLAEENEFVVIAKTTEANFEKVKAEVEKIHPYEIPCIVKIPVSSNKKYFDWVKKEVL